MRLDQELSSSSPAKDAVLTIGVFDGVHRGHHHLISHLKRESNGTGRVSGVVTFSDHPLSILRPKMAPKYISTLDERLRMIGKLGVDFVCPITFDIELSRLSVRDFILRLQETLHMRGLVVGPDFAMGHNRKGDVKELASLGEEMGFSVKVVDILMDGDTPVRSTTIRHKLAEGDVATAASLLGRNFSLIGVVVSGEKRGRTLGFPTANLEVPPSMAIPADGIYATWIHLPDGRHMAATSIGTRPTFDNGNRTVEAFVLDFDGDLYDKELRLEFVERLRPEEKFDTVEALVEQINEDVAQTRAVLGGAGAISADDS